MLIRSNPIKAHEWPISKVFTRPRNEHLGKKWLWNASQSMVKFMTMMGPCQRHKFEVANWHLPSTSTRIKSCAAAATDLQHPPVESSGSRTEMRHSALEITGRIGVQIVRYFQDLILWAQFLHLISRKTLNSFLVTSTPPD